MSNLKRYRQLGGGSFYKFDTKGQVLEGTWQGTQAGKYGDNGVVEVNGVPQMFTLNTALRDLTRVHKGTEVRITYLGKAMSKAGNEFKSFKVEVEESAEVSDREEPDESDEVPF